MLTLILIKINNLQNTKTLKSIVKVLLLFRSSFPIEIEFNYFQELSISSLFLFFLFFFFLNIVQVTFLFFINKCCVFLRFLKY